MSIIYQIYLLILITIVWVMILLIISILMASMTAVQVKLSQVIKRRTFNNLFKEKLTVNCGDY